MRGIIEILQSAEAGGGGGEIRHFVTSTNIMPIIFTNAY